MSHTNRTTNLQLPQFTASDKPTWLGDVNGAMLTIDTAYGNIEATANGATSTANNALTNANNAVTTANQASSDASDAVSDASLALTTANNAISTANSASSTANSASSTANSASSTANSALSTANSAIGKANALETLVGDDDISSIGDGSITGAINDLIFNSASYSDILTLASGITVNTLRCWKQHNVLKINLVLIIGNPSTGTFPLFTLKNDFTPNGTQFFPATCYTSSAEDGYGGSIIVNGNDGIASLSHSGAKGVVISSIDIVLT